MPSLPDRISPSFFFEAIELLDSGRETNFAESTVYDVLFEGRRYSPKALVGLAAELQEGDAYFPEDFSGGLDSKCFRLLETADFEIVLKEGAREKQKSSANPYIEALRNVTLTSREKELIRYHYNAPNRTVSSEWLASQLSAEGEVGNVNRAYGAIAQRIGEHLPWNRPASQTWIGYLVTFPRGSDGIKWKMRTLFADALEILGIVNPKSEMALAEEIDSDQTCPEGAKRTITVNAYERSSEARKKCLRRYGYRCSVCDILLSEMYGEVADGLIHVHHLKPISEIGEEYEVDPIDDLRPVCPNCHAVIHRRRPQPFDIEEVKEFLRENQSRSD